MEMCNNNAPLDAIVFCGPSGVGKGTLLGRLMKKYAEQFGYSVSHTTREPRQWEVDGREYHFVDRSKVQQLQEEGQFLELCEVHGNLYGTTLAAVKAVQNSGRICIIELDVEGAKKLRENRNNMNLLYIFVTAPSLEDLRDRIKKRGADNEETVQRRMQTANKELDFVKTNPEFFTYILVNEDLDVAYVNLVRILNEELVKRNMKGLMSD